MRHVPRDKRASTWQDHCDERIAIDDWRGTNERWAGLSPDDPPALKNEDKRLSHAKSLWDDPNQTDHARPLNARGQVAAASMGRALRDLGLSPDIVLVSSARRTLQTLDALSPWEDTPLFEPMDTLYLAPASMLLHVIRGVTDTVRSLMVLGHNPGMHDLAVELAGGEATLRHGQHRRLVDGFPTGGLVEYTVTGPWSSLGAETARIQRFLTPRDLPEGTKT
jgi:phosphohistidine phosphatase